MQEGFYISVKNVRRIIMQRWLMIHVIIVSLTLLLYQTVIAALLMEFRKTLVLENSTWSECEQACRVKTEVDCVSYQFWNSSRKCILTGKDNTSDQTPDESHSPSNIKESTFADPEKRVRRNAYNHGLEENVDKLWHDLAKYQNDKQTLKEFEKLVVAELKTKTKEVKALQMEKEKQSKEISGLKQVVEKLLTQTSDINKKIEDVKTEQASQQHQISGLEFSDQKLTAGMGKLIVQTEELASRVNKLSDADVDSKQRIGDLETLTHQLHASVETLMEEQKVIHDVAERVAVLSEKTSIMGDRISALQEHQVVSEKEMTNIKATMERLVKTMEAVDESQMRVSSHMDALDYNVSDHDVLMKELLVKQTRDGRKLHKDMAALITKSTEQTQAFEELKAQTSQTSGRFNALTASIAKVSERNDKIRDKLEHLVQTSRKATEEFQRRASLQSDDIKKLATSQQNLKTQLSKLGNDEVVLASELKKVPSLMSELSGDLGRIRAGERKLDSELTALKSEAESLKIAVSNVQARESIKPVVLSVNDPLAPNPSRDTDETQLLRLQNLRTRLGEVDRKRRELESSEIVPTRDVGLQKPDRRQKNITLGHISKLVNLEHQNKKKRLKK